MAHGNVLYIQTDGKEKLVHAVPRGGIYNTYYCKLFSKLYAQRIHVHIYPDKHVYESDLATFNKQY